MGWTHCANCPNIQQCAEADCCIAPDEKIVQTREATHGPFAKQAHFAQLQKQFLREMPQWRYMAFHEREALDMIVVKISRIGHGDPHEPDHWNDIAGYARLGGNPEVKAGE